MLEKKIYIITGGPGFGKTQLVEELRSSGYLCADEFARQLIEAELNSGGEILPWRNPKRFQHEVLKRRIAFFESVPDHTIAFADRGIPDQLAFARYKGFGTPEILSESAGKYRYAPFVFVLPPWPEIYENDLIRTETFDEAVRIHHTVLEVYSELNYQKIDIPLLPVKQRKEFVLKTMLKINNNDY